MSPNLSRRKIVLGAAALATPLAAAPGTALAQACRVTSSDILGPYWRNGAPFVAALAPPDEPGTRLRITGRVLAADCRTPLPGTVLDLWQADSSGLYDNDDPKHDLTQFRLRGQLRTDAEGRYELTSVMPGRYLIPPGLPGFGQFAGQTRPAHIHLTVGHPMFGPMTTQIYFSGDPHIASDPWARKSREVVAVRPTGPGLAGEWDIVLALPDTMR